MAMTNVAGKRAFCESTSNGKPTIALKTKPLSNAMNATDGRANKKENDIRPCSIKTTIGQSRGANTDAAAPPHKADKNNVPGEDDMGCVLT